MTNLDELRREIDGIDDQLLTLLGRRIEIGRAVARSKAPNGGPFLRPGREAAILRRLSAAAPAAIAPAVISRIWRQILVASLAQHRRARPNPGPRSFRRQRRSPCPGRWPGGDRSGRRWRRVGGRDLL